jgi:hypothetical protein
VIAAASSGGGHGSDELRPSTTVDLVLPTFGGGGLYRSRRG